MDWASWVLAGLAALSVGLGKGGIPGVGNLAVVLFAMVFDPKASVGLLLPVLIAADVVAVTVYRRHVEWRYLLRLLPWLGVGIVLGYFVFDWLSNTGFQRLIGSIVLLMTFMRMLKLGAVIPHHFLFRSGMGITGGFATMVANAAGPVAQIYFLSIGLPKLAFIGTGAWCFFIVNLVKVPLQVDLGIIHFESLRTSFLLAPLAVIGALTAPRVVHWIPQKLFERLVWIFIVVVGLKLVIA